MTAVATNPQARSLKRLWSRLPAGPLTEERLDEAIIEAANLYPGDYATALALRSSLVIAQAVTVRQGDKPREPTYERVSEFPEHPPNHVGSDAYNRELERQHREHEELMRQQDAHHAQQFAESPLGQQREMIIALIDQRVEEAVNARVGELLRSLDDPSISRMRERLTNDAARAASTEDNGRTAGQED